MEKVRERTREPEPGLDRYDANLKFMAEMRRRRKEGKVLLRAVD